MRIELYILKEGGREIKLDIPFEEYIRPAILWLSESNEELAKALDVLKVASEGIHIMGIFGGEKKEGMEHYAGLAVSSMKPADGGFYLKLYNMDKEYFVPLSLMKKYKVDVYRTLYPGTIIPFKCSTINVLLSSLGEEKLRAFIQELARLNDGSITKADKERLERLSIEARGEAKRILDSNSYYVVYKGNRIFSACVPEDLEKTINHHNIGYVKCRSAEQAHYYAAVLNFLAFEAIKREGGFLRNQFARPLIVIAHAGLGWRDVPPQLRSEVARLSYELSKKLTWTDYSNQRQAFSEIARRPEFRRIVELLEEYIKSTGKQEKLEEALRLVAESTNLGAP